jgi:membrane fusion protein (multidrug efflux system)
MQLTISRNYKWLVWACLTVFALVAWRPTAPLSAKPDLPQPASPKIIGIEVAGRTQCVPNRKAIIAPVPLHPVEEVLVAVGDRVKKGQPLVKLDSDEQQAEVRARKAALENAGIALNEALRYRSAIEKHADAIPEHKHHEVRVAALKAENDQRAAKAALESAEAELEHYTVVAPIDGVLNRLDVHVGMVSRPGTTIWGEILDLSEIDVRCELSPDQADAVAISQAAEVRSVKKKELFGVGRVTFIGFSADKTSGLIPVVIRLPNPKWRLRCEVPVQVRFTDNVEAAGP